MTHTNLEVRHNAARSRYEVSIDGRLAGFADYRDANGPVVFLHTEVEVAQRGQGIGGELVRGALDDVRRRGGTVVARCPFVSRFIDEHPEYDDLREA